MHTSNNNATLASLTAEMHAKQSVLNGWGAVLNISHTYLNRVFSKNWSNLDAAADPSLRTLHLLHVQASEPGSSAATAGRRRVGLIELDLSQPRVGLAKGRNAATISHEIHAIRGRSGTAPEDVRDHRDPRIAWDTNGTIDIPVEENPQIEGEVPIEVVPQAGAEETFDVMMDLERAILQSHHLPSAANVGAADLSRKVKQALGNGAGQVKVVEVNGETPTRIASLQPKSVRLGTVHTPEENQVLQVFIANTVQPPEVAAVAVQEPIPSADGADWSLMINSKTVFEEVVADGFNAQSDHIKLEVVAPASPEQAWYAKTQNRMFFQGTVTWGDVMPPIKQHAQIGLNLCGSPAGGLVVSTYTQPGANIDLDFTIEQSFAINPTNTQPSQGLTFDNAPASVGATGVAENTFKPHLEFILNTDLGQNMAKVDLSALDSFAKQTVQVVGEEMIVHQVHIPGEMVLAGNLEPVS